VENRFVIDHVERGHVNSYPLSIPDGIETIHITIAWNDPPAQLNSAKALVNDLDIELKNISTGEIWQPWVLNAFPHPDSLLLPAQRNIDTLNNIEQITLEIPIAGEYEIWVKGGKMISDEQEFSLTWMLEKQNLFQWTFPTASDYLVPNHEHILRWNASGNKKGKITYKYIDQDTWTHIAGDVDPNSGQLKWKTPGSSGLIQLQWSNADTSILSDTFFLIEPLRPKVGLVCPDSILFYWNNEIQADSFQILKLGSRHLEHFATTADTFYVSHLLMNDTYHYAVAPIYDGKTGPQSYGFDYRTQGVRCYIKTFFLKEVIAGKAFFTARLGSLYNVESVVLEKLQGDDYTLIQELTPPVTTDLTLMSDELQDGITWFRMKVILNNGATYLSEPVAVYYIRHTDILIFPNPASDHQEITILVKRNVDFNLKILDMLGREISTLTETENPQIISTSNLVSGQYVALIIYEDGDMEAQIFFVRQ